MPVHILNAAKTIAPLPLEDPELFHRAPVAVVVDQADKVHEGPTMHIAQEMEKIIVEIDESKPFQKVVESNFSKDVLESTLSKDIVESSFPKDESIDRLALTNILCGTTNVALDTIEKSNADNDQGAKDEIHIQDLNQDDGDDEDFISIPAIDFEAEPDF